MDKKEQDDLLAKQYEIYYTGNSQEDKTVEEEGIFQNAKVIIKLLANMMRKSDPETLGKGKPGDAFKEKFFGDESEQ